MMSTHVNDNIKNMERILKLEVENTGTKICLLDQLEDVDVVQCTQRKGLASTKGVESLLLSSSEVFELNK